MDGSALERLRSALGDRYLLERELGAGGMAVVYLARDLRHGRQVALKVLRPELAAAIGHQRFLQEIRVTASLQHPHILPLHDSGEAAGQLYYVMPFVDGESLRARLTSGAAIPIADIVSYLGDVAEALAYAHERGVIHRDIKPDNVLVSGGAAVVSDFGIGKALSAARAETESGPLTHTGMSIGTPAYMAPEQAAGDPGTDHRADLYAFGCMAYELLTGRTPFAADTAQRMLAGHLGESARPVAELRPDTPAPLAEIIMRCLAKEARDRPAGAGEIAKVLRSAVVRAPLPLPRMLVAGPGAFWRALAIYLTSAVGVVLLARLLRDAIGLPDWVVPAAAFLMALGLPVILVTGYVQHLTRRALAATPAFTPGGTAVPPGAMSQLAIKAVPRLTWRRTGLGAAGAVLALVLLTAGYMGMRAWGIGPAGTLVAKGRLKETPLLLIADVTVKSADPELGSAVAEGVRANLNQSKALTLLSPTDRTAALRRMRLPDTARVDLERARQIAGREGVAAIVDGELTGLGAGFIVTLRLVSADSGKILVSFQETAEEAGGLIPAVDAATRKLRSRIGESLNSVRASPPLARLTTSSLEALRLYSGSGSISQVQTRVQRLRRAVAIDPDFAMGWRSLAIAMNNSRFPVSSVDSAITRAYELRARLPDVERLGIEAFYFGVGPGSDRQKQMEAQDALLRAGDSSTGTLNNQGMNASSMRQWVRAESLFRAAMRRGPELNAYYNIVVPLFAQGKLVQADSFTTFARTKNANNGAFIMNSRRALYLRGDVEGFERSLDSARSGPANPGRGPIVTGAWATVAQLRGRLRDAEEGWAEVAALDSELKVGHLDLVDSIRSAHFDVWYRSRPDRGIARLETALARYPLNSMAGADRPYANIAIVYAMAGRPERARAILGQLTRSGDSVLIRRRQPDIHSALAEIALAESRPRDAIVEFRRADIRADGGSQDQNPLQVLANLGRAFDQAHEPDSAIAYFERFLDTPYWHRVGGPDPEHGKETYEPSDPIFLARVYRRLGELYDEKNDPLNAARYYRRFIDLWKNADPELQSKVAEVKRRVRSLTDTERPHQP